MLWNFFFLFFFLIKSQTRQDYENERWDMGKHRRNLPRKFPSEWLRLESFATYSRVMRYIYYIFILFAGLMGWSSTWSSLIYIFFNKNLSKLWLINTVTSAYGESIAFYLPATSRPTSSHFPSSPALHHLS